MSLHAVLAFCLLAARPALADDRPEPPGASSADPSATAEEPAKECLCPCACEREIEKAPFKAAEIPGDFDLKRNFRWTPYASPGYTPEVGGLLAGGFLFSWSFDPKDPLLPRSSIPAAVSFSTTGAILVSLLPSFYLKSDRLRINAKLYFKDMKDNYWGVGFEEGSETEMGEETTQYKRLWWQVSPRVVYQVVPHLFVGGVLDFNQTVAGDLNPKMADDPDVLEDGTSNYNGGIGAIVQYDTRDFPQSSFQGVLLELQITGYGPWFGSDNLYMLYVADYRHHLPLGKRPGNTLAWNIHSAGVIGNAPWSEKPMVGSPFDLRGYYWGRFRDDFANWLLLEYRYMFPTKREGRAYSRSGFVAWAGLGYLGGRFLEAAFLPNVGVGYRFEVQPRMNLRVDFGFGAYQSFGFYISFLEAF